MEELNWFVHRPSIKSPATIRHISCEENYAEIFKGVPRCFNCGTIVPSLIVDAGYLSGHLWMPDAARDVQYMSERWLEGKERLDRWAEEETKGELTYEHNESNTQFKYIG